MFYPHEYKQFLIDWKGQALWYSVRQKSKFGCLADSRFFLVNPKTAQKRCHRNLKIRMRSPQLKRS